MLFLQVLATNLAQSASSVINSERIKKAVNVSQSPITYVQHLVHQPAAESKIKLPKTNKGNKVEKQKNVMSNHELLLKLGLNKLPSPTNHHRKRLASQSRHVSRPDDSRVFIVKLPPNPDYYSHFSNFKPQVNEPGSHDAASKKVTQPEIRDAYESLIQIEFLSQIPVGFKSNGKPGAIYHWNLPLISKIINDNNGRSNSKRYKEKKASYSDITDLIADIPTWTDDSSATLWNETLAFPAIDDKKFTYVPFEKRELHKSFPSNGKPKSFYIYNNLEPHSRIHNLID